MNQDILYIVAILTMSITAGAVWYVVKTFTEEFKLSRLVKHGIVSAFTGLVISLLIPDGTVSRDIELSIVSFFALIAYPLISNMEDYWRIIVNAIFRLFNVPIEIPPSKHAPAPMPPKISDQNLQDQEDKISNP